MAVQDSPILPLQVRDLGYAVRGRFLLRGASFELAAGAPTIVLGPNGAGKTLTLRLCHGLIEPSEGQVRWSSEPRIGAHAMVFQRPIVLRRSVRANITYALSLMGLSRAARAERANATLEHFGLTAIAARPARVLSGGEKQRLALARAWALRPQVLFLDEPTSALDPAATHTIEAMLESMAAEGVKIVMSTHDLGQARRLAGDVLFLNGGRLVEHSPAETFFNAPQSAEAAAFLRGELVW